MSAKAIALLPSPQEVSFQRAILGGQHDVGADRPKTPFGDVIRANAEGSRLNRVLGAALRIATPAIHVVELALDAAFEQQCRLQHIGAHDRDLI